MTSVERMFKYADEKPEIKTGQEVSGWPKIGEIKYENVCLTYKTTGENVLRNISFEIAGNIKTGIVGRTGARKSSIKSTLSRFYDYDGKMTIDGVDTKTLLFELVTSKIGIILQDPILFSGAIRSNIDPLNQYSDSEIWAAIERVQMKSSVSSLDQKILDNSQNYSSGQRQLLCLARALVCKNKIIVLDEATANMDLETDQLLQKTIHENYEKCTVLNMAHRLHSFNTADQVLVVEGGRIVEFGEPTKLLLNRDGLFYKMVKDAGGVNFL